MATSNTLTGLIPVIYEALDIVAQEKIGLIGAVNTDVDVSAVGKGQTITTYQTPDAVLEDSTPGVNPTNSGGQTLTPVNITMTNEKVAPVLWNGNEQLLVRGLYSNILRDQFAQGFRALRNAAEGSLVTEATASISDDYGTAGTTPFADAGDMSELAAMVQLLDKIGAPESDRSLVLDTVAVANMRSNFSNLFSVNEAGDDTFLRNGALGSIYGLTLRQSGKIVPVGTTPATTTNIALHKSALVLAARPLSFGEGGDSAVDVTVVTDPVSGLSFSVAMYKQYRQTKIEVGMTWGVKAIKPAWIF